MHQSQINNSHSQRVIKIGSRIPTNIFKVLSGDLQASILSDDIFKNKKVVLFSVPGAFNQKSTNVQIPGYIYLAEKIFEQGIDEIICVSVNDAFVMDAWVNHCKVEQIITMLSDAHCHFFNSVGLEMDCTRFNLGFRCERFSMIIFDGILKKLNIEVAGGPVNASSAEEILKNLKENSYE